MKYRVIAIGVRVNDRPVQIYGGDIAPMKKWAAEIAERHNTAVEIHVTEERLLETVVPKEEENVRSQSNC